MKKTIYLLLFPLLSISCKKDSPAESYTFNGIVLRFADHKPVTGAQVMLQFERQSSTRPDVYIPVQYAAITDNNGVYTIKVSDRGTEPYYYAFAQKKACKQMDELKTHLIANTTPDTLYLDEASYLSLDISIKTRPSTGFAELSWYMKSATAPPGPTILLQPLRYRSYLSFTQPNTETILDSFSYIEHKRAYIQLSTQETNKPVQILLDKEITLDSLKTAHVKFEY